MVGLEVVFVVVVVVDVGLGDGVGSALPPGMSPAEVETASTTVKQIKPSSFFIGRVSVLSS